ncbi:MAG: glycosyltransferase [Sphingobacteriaceae bacterium]|nr:glycosyltransferase [Sphingobacteriaceae bacterium]
MEQHQRIRVLHVIAGDLSGGAAKGALALHYALLSKGLDSYVLNDHKIPDGVKYFEKIHTVDSVENTFRRRIMSLFRRLFFKVFVKENSIFNMNFGYISMNEINKFDNIDVVNLHWVTGMIDVNRLNKIKRPIVWTIRDMWPVTGGCHYAFECEGFKKNCKDCPQLKRGKNKISQYLLNKKNHGYPQIKTVSISGWLHEIVNSSKLFSRNKNNNYFIPNTISSDFFFENKITARKYLNLTNDKKIILLGVQNQTDYYKGFDLAEKALEILRDKNYLICTFGRHVNISTNNLLNFGFISDNIKLSNIYAAADVYLFPSRQETFGKTLAEAMKCGTPAVSFNASGQKDIIDHKINGYLAEPYSPEDLARGIEWVLHHPNYDELSKNARKKVEEKFDGKIVAQQYIDLYKKILEEKTNE